VDRLRLPCGASGRPGDLRRLPIGVGRKSAGSSDRPCASEGSPLRNFDSAQRGNPKRFHRLPAGESGSFAHPIA